MRKGSKHSPESIEKNRLSHLGKKHPSGFEGKHHSEESKKKTSISMKGKLSGEKHPFYGKYGKEASNYKNPEDRITPLNQAIRNLPQTSEWKAQVRGRDNWTCQHCNTRGVWLEAHHIKSLAFIIKKYNIKNIEDAYNCSELWDINNGITLCKECHDKITFKKEE